MYSLCSINASRPTPNSGVALSSISGEKELGLLNFELDSALWESIEFLFFFYSYHQILLESPAASTGKKINM